MHQLSGTAADDSAGEVGPLRSTVLLTTLQPGRCCGLFQVVRVFLGLCVYLDMCVLEFVWVCVCMWKFQ